MTHMPTHPPYPVTPDGRYFAGRGIPFGSLDRLATSRA